MTPSDDEWLQRFAREHGRPLRVLHIGNIGNNAYLNALFLRAAGVECHVLARDYYDELGTPEWEGATRPCWLAQGPFSTAAAYLAAHADRRPEAPLLWSALELQRRVVPRLGSPTGRANVHARFAYAASYGSSLARLGGRKLARAAGRQIDEPAAAPDLAGQPWARHLVDAYDEVFPDRAPLPLDDLRAYGNLDRWRSLLVRYDVVEAYATEVVPALLTGARPYVAYEHGTLRVFTGEGDALSRLTALAYRLSDHAFVTNGDCVPIARDLGIPSYTPTIHPLDVEQHRRAHPAERAAIRSRYGRGPILFCPMRHDWEVKGTDVHLRALPQLVKRYGEGVMLLLCAWGRDVQRSRSLLHELGVSRHVAWLERLRREPFIAHLQAADVVLDQMTLPHFDATVPQALAAGAPVVMSYRPESTTWIAQEPAPILSAFGEAGVVEAVGMALDQAWRADYAARAGEWIDRWHGPGRVVSDHLRAYREVLKIDA